MLTLASLGRTLSHSSKMTHTPAENITQPVFRMKLHSDLGHMCAVQWLASCALQWHLGNVQLCPNIVETSPHSAEKNGFCHLLLISACLYNTRVWTMSWNILLTISCISLQHVTFLMTWLLISMFGPVSWRLCHQCAQVLGKQTQFAIAGSGTL